MVMLVSSFVMEIRMMVMICDDDDTDDDDTYDDTDDGGNPVQPRPCSSRPCSSKTLFVHDLVRPRTGPAKIGSARPGCKEIDPSTASSSNDGWLS